MLRFRILSAFVVCASALASTSIASAQAKIGVVNFQKAIGDTQELKKAQNDLIVKFKPQQDQYDKANRDYNDLQIQLQNSQGKGLSAAAEVDLQARAQRAQREVERLKEDLDADVQKERDETIQRLGSRMTEIVKKLMDEKGLDAIFDSAALVAFKTTVEITADATAAYDKAYPVTVAAAAAKQ
ncbi:MAG TPA: OmpH family outer membrane protein [Bryobacteraceae bacterium]|jgi:outer membrane protein